MNIIPSTSPKTEVTFTANLFITEHHFGQNWKYEQSDQKFLYQREWAQRGLLITEWNYIRHGKGGSHDGHAVGWHFKIKGKFTYSPWNKSGKLLSKTMIRFLIFHEARRVDYFNCNPITFSSIKLQ